jgi:hypothetical protein
LTILGPSNAAPLRLFGRIAIPATVWGALIIPCRQLSHLIGWPLVGIDQQQRRISASTWCGRENEQIALLRGDSRGTPSGSLRTRGR